MLRVKKLDGWNKYKIQRRFLFVFWRDLKLGRIYIGRGNASIAAMAMAVNNSEGFKV